MGKKVRIRIRYDHPSELLVLIILAMVVTVFLVFLAWGQKDANAATSSLPIIQTAGVTSLKRFYLTTSSYNGSQADGSDGNGAGVCAAGYHFASLWEILDPSNLEYNTSLGYTTDDSGQGPPSYGWGWVRTGYPSDGSSTPGSANCYGWDSTTGKGTNVVLSASWGTDENISPWVVAADGCDFTLYVWCVEDKIGEEVYLPIILR